MSDEATDVFQFVPVGSEPEGNTNSSGSSHAPSKYWAFTLNNYTETDILNFRELDCSTVPVLVFQEEIAPTTGTPHLQGAIMFLKKVRPLKMFRKMGFPEGLHWGKRLTKTNEKGKPMGFLATDDEFFGYCCDGTKRKEGGRVYIRGYQATYKKWIQEIPTLYDWQQNILNLLDNPGDARTIHWFWEPDGCAGKTTFLKYIHTHYDRVAISGGKCDDMKNCIFQYVKENKVYPEHVIINYEREEPIDYKGIKCTKDMFFYSGKYEGGAICGPCPNVIIMANMPPNESRLSKGVFNVTRI